MEPTKKRCIVGIGSVCVENGRAELTAYAIGSCIALCLYESAAAVGAMAHILLPSRGHIGGMEGATTKYADQALDAALQRMCELGADRCRVEAAIVGGAEMFPHGSVKTLNIGEMNVASVCLELQNRGIPLKAAITGGNKSRTVTFSIPGSGFAEQLSVRSPRK